MTAPTLTKFTCLDCRRTFKRPIEQAAKRNAPRAIEIRTCPHCGGNAYLMGGDFRAPPLADDRAWSVVDVLVRAGLPYFRLHEALPLSTMGHPAVRPKGLQSVSRRLVYPTDLKEAQAFVAAHHDLAMPFVQASADGG